MTRKRVGVLVSGRGSNLQALLDACAAPDFPAEIVLVVSNIPGVQGLTRAYKAGVPTATVNHRDYPSREAFEAALDATLRAAGVDIVCLAGFMRVLTAGFVEAWAGRLINVHPSLLPAFKGLHTHERALAAGVRFHGCSVHFVKADVDAGPVIVQGVVPVRPDDSAEALATRVLAVEHKIYPHALRLVAEGRARALDDRVELAHVPSRDGVLINPPLE